MLIESILDSSAREPLEPMFRTMIEAAPCGLVTVDTRGSIVLVNAAAELLFGYARTELIGNAIEMLLPERCRTAHVGHRHAFAAAPSIRQMGFGRDLTARRKDGTEFPVEVGLNPVPGDASGLVLVAVIDITRHKALQLELQQANADLEEFTYAVSHDLKSPLRGIADLVEWIGEDLGERDAPQIVRNLGRVGVRIRRLERVIDDLLTYARSGTASAEAVPIEPHALIESVLEMQSLPPGFEVSVDIDAGPLVASRTPLETVLRNLIDNAVKHHDRPEGNIGIRVGDIERYCVFTVSDDGPGIPVAARERVFRRFQSLSSGTTGIGLALSKRLAELHGGRIVLDSAGEVRGTSFRVWWPRFQRKKAESCLLPRG